MNHLTNRSRRRGGLLCSSGGGGKMFILVVVEKCKKYDRTRSGQRSLKTSVRHSGVRCTLDLPNAFEHGDGVQVVNKGIGVNEDDAAEDACQTTVAWLLCTGASQVDLCSWHWMIPIEQLLAELNQALLDQVWSVPLCPGLESASASVGAEQKLAPAREISWPRWECAMEPMYIWPSYSMPPASPGQGGDTSPWQYGYTYLWCE